MIASGERFTPSSSWFSGPASAVVSEDACLALVDEVFPSRNPHVPLGRGDDCAELLVATPLALSTDIFAQDTHFRTSYFSPAEVGGKALTTAISDLAAAGARPLGFSLGLTLPPGLHKNALRDLLLGMRRVADTHGVSLSGGDISRGDRLHLCLTVWGESVAPGENFFLRRGAALPGDCIFLIGALGLARAGLLLLERQGRAACAKHPVPCAAHLRPSALMKQGQALARLVWEQRESVFFAEDGNSGKMLLNGSLEHAVFSRFSSSEENPEQRSPNGKNPRFPNPRVGLMDVSDGLARDLPRLLKTSAHHSPRSHTLAEDLGADILIPESLICPELRAAAGTLGKDPLELLLVGGEDYALIGTCNQDFWPLLRARIPDAHPIGQVVRWPGIYCNKAPLACAGFDHFARETPVSGPSAPETSGAGSDFSVFPGFVPAAADVTQVCFRAWQRGLLAGFNGNASCRLIPIDPSSGQDESPACLVTRSGAAKSALTPDDFAILSLKDGALLAGAEPSSEAAMHLAVYRNCPEAGGILHCHPPCLLALSLRLPPETMLRLPLFEAETYGARLGHVADLPPGSGELAEAVGQEAKRYPAVWMRGHGLMVRSHSLSGALALAEELEQLARIQLLSCGNFSI